MALIVEDGSGVPDANSYVDAAYAVDYFNLRANTAWPTDAAAQEAALIQATDYIEARFGARFIGLQASDTQALSWPRIGAANFADDEIPATLKKATCEYAVRAAHGPLIPDLTTDNGVITTVASKAVGPISKSYSVLSRGFGSTVELFPPWPAADLLMRDLLVAYATREVIR